MKTLILLIISSATSLMFAQSVMFQKQMNSNNPTAQALCINKTNDGGFVIAMDTMTFACVNASTTVIRTDSNGTIVWSKNFYWVLGAEYYIINYVQQTSDNGFIVVGNTIESSTQYSFMIKTDSNGDFLWWHRYLTPTNTIISGSGFTPAILFNFGMQAKEMDDHGFIVVGVSYDNSDSLYSYRVIKTDSMGNVIWIKNYNPSIYLGGCKLALVGNNSTQGFVISGYGVDSAVNGAGHAFVTSIDYQGSVLWAKKYLFNEDAGNAIEKCSDNGFIITGYERNNMAPYIMALKIDSVGNVQWSQFYGTIINHLSLANSVKQTSDGGYILGGNYLVTPDDGQAVLVKINSSGDLQWGRIYYGNNRYSYMLDLTVTDDGGYAFCGCIYDSIPNQGASSVYLVRTDSLGNTGCFDSAFTFIQMPGNLHSVTYSPLVTSETISVDEPASCSMVNQPITSVNICSTLGIENSNENINTINVFPNPFTTATTLTIQGTCHNPSLFIYNLLGQVVETLHATSLQSGTNTQLTINRERLASGMYFYKVIDDNKEVIGIGKMVIE